MCMIYTMPGSDASIAYTIYTYIEALPAIDWSAFSFDPTRMFSSCSEGASLCRPSDRSPRRDHDSVQMHRCEGGEPDLADRDFRPGGNDRGGRAAHALQDLQEQAKALPQRPMDSDRWPRQARQSTAHAGLGRFVLAAEARHARNEQCDSGNNQRCADDAAPAIGGRRNPPLPVPVELVSGACHRCNDLRKYPIRPEYSHTREVRGGMVPISHASVSR